MTEPAGTIRANIPVPDPSEITSKEIAKLRSELLVTFSSAIAGSAEYAAAKLDSLSKLTDERFEGLKIAFREDKIAAATAVAAAFAAQEKLAIAQNLSNTAAITKSEGSTTKELESLDGKIGGLKETVASDIRNLEGRLNRGEGGVIGARQTVAETHSSIGAIVGIVGGITGTLALLVMLFNALHAAPGPYYQQPAAPTLTMPVAPAMSAAPAH